MCLCLHRNIFALQKALRLFYEKHRLRRALHLFLLFCKVQKQKNTQTNRRHSQGSEATEESPEILANRIVKFKKKRMGGDSSVNTARLRMTALILRETSPTASASLVLHRNIFALQKALRLFYEKHFSNSSEALDF